jgi:hypothetical protein
MATKSGRPRKRNWNNVIDFVVAQGPLAIPPYLDHTNNESPTGTNGVA